MAPPRNKRQPVDDRAGAVFGADEAGCDREGHQRDEECGQLERCAGGFLERGWVSRELDQRGLGNDAVILQRAAVPALLLKLLAAGSPVLVSLLIRALCGSALLAARG